MKLHLKIVLAGINIMSLLVTLLYPNTATPYSLLPVIVTSCSWVFISSEGRYGGKTFFAIAATILGSFCIFFGTTSSISPVVDATNQAIAGKYSIAFNDAVALFATKSMDYQVFFYFALFMIAFLVLSEIISDFWPLNCGAVDGSFDDRVNRLIKK